MMIKKRLHLLVLPIVAVFVTLTLLAASPAAQKPVLAKIPGLTDKDVFPRGCVDCHIKAPEGDMRMSTLMKQWNQKVDPALMAKIQPFAPAGVKLKGKHPTVAASLANIPAACMKCHAEGSKIAPPFVTMLHAIHYTGGDKNRFLTMFQGQCTHCHKMNAKTAAWSIPSGAEK